MNKYNIKEEEIKMDKIIDVLDEMNDNKFTGNSKEIIDILGKKWKYNCMGCSIMDGTIMPPGGIIYNGKNVALAADPEVPIPGFLIINFKRHVRSFSELYKEERDEISDVLYYAEKAIKELNICNEFTIVQEERSKHFHIWIFPNYEWMTKKYGKGVTYLIDIMDDSRKNSNEIVINKILDVVDKVREYFKDNYKPRK